MEDAFTADVVDALYGMEAGDTFAVRIEDEGSSLGPRTEYCRVETVYDGISRDHDRLMKMEMGRDPSADHPRSVTVFEADGGGAEIRRLGGFDTVIHGVAADALAVDYTSDRTLTATCDECGRTGTVPVSEADLPVIDPLLTDDGDGATVTACCSANWTTAVEDDAPRA